MAGRVSGGAHMTIRSFPLAMAALVTSASLSVAQGAIRLRETMTAGAEWHVSTRVELAGELTVPPEAGQKAPSKVSLSGRSVIEYDERILDTGTPARPGPRTLRIYRRVDLELTAGAKPQ